LFNGIECDEFSSKIAEVAMWLIDHQMNLKVSEEFGQYFARLPLKKSAKILCENSLRIDWEDVVSKKELSYIIGNPPFNGTAYQNQVQKEDMSTIFRDVKGYGNLDYVSAWFLKAAIYIKNTTIKVGFVSTNSITQGEQANILWKELFKKNGVYINIAHKTFNWTNKAKGKAAVHVVIICFSLEKKKEKILYEYKDGKGDPQLRKVKIINQ
jgi:type I restriction-modification system DNA methylase subunit